MKSRILLLLLFLFLPFGFLSAQQSPGSTQDGCALYNRLENMSQSEFEKLLAKAQAGESAAQYQRFGSPNRRACRKEL